MLAHRPQQVKTQQGPVAGQGSRLPVFAELRFAALPFDAPARGFVASHYPIEIAFYQDLPLKKYTLGCHPGLPRLATLPVATPANSRGTK